MQIRSFGKNGQFTMVDWTEELVQTELQARVLENLGLFQPEYLTQHTFEYEETISGHTVILDRVRGERNTMSSSGQRRIRTGAVPHFPLDDALLPQDIMGKRAWGGADVVETEAAAIDRKLKQIAKSHNQTREIARWELLLRGNVYAPNGTVAMNMFTEFGVTQKIVDFDLGNGATNVLLKQEEVLSHIRLNAQDENIDSVVILASTEYFNAYINQAGVIAAYNQYASSQEPLRTRVGAGGDVNWGARRRFLHGDVLIIEVYESIKGTRCIPAGLAVAIPLGTEVFTTFFSPANTFGYANTVAQEAYLFEFEGQYDDKREVKSESNFANFCRRPALMVICKMNAATPNP